MGAHLRNQETKGRSERFQPVVARFAVFLTFFIVGLVSESREDEAAKTPDLIILLTGDTQGFLEDCGCRKTTEGGIARRVYQIKRIRDQWPGRVLVVDAGRVLSGDEAVERQRAVTYIKAMKSGGYDTVNVGVTDLAFGPAFLAETFVSQGLTLLSTNLWARDVNIKKCVTTDISNMRIALLGLTEPAGDFPTSGAKVLNPETALEQALAGLETKPDLTVVLSDLSHDHNRELLIRLRGKINLLLGSLEGRVSETIAGTCVARSARNGRSMTRVDVFIGKHKGECLAQVSSIPLPESEPEDPLTRTLLTDFYRSFENDPGVRGEDKMLLSDQPIERLQGNTYYPEHNSVDTDSQSAVIARSRSLATNQSHPLSTRLRRLLRRHRTAARNDVWRFCQQYHAPLNTSELRSVGRAMKKSRWPGKKQRTQKLTTASCPVRGTICRIVLCATQRGMATTPGTR